MFLSFFFKKKKLSLLNFWLLSCFAPITELPASSKLLSTKISSSFDGDLSYEVHHSSKWSQSSQADLRTLVSLSPGSPSGQNCHCTRAGGGHQHFPSETAVLLEGSLWWGAGRWQPLVFLVCPSWYGICILWIR